MNQRRQLSFSSFEEIVEDVEHLLRGCHTTGFWSFAQICNHLRLSLDTVTDSSGKIPHSDGAEDPRVAASRGRFFRECRFPDDVAVPSPHLVPGSGLDGADEALALLAALTRFEAAEEPFVAHPYLGVLTKTQWHRFHCIHAAHHLSFAIPDPDR